jgi:hypothetical protein
MPAVRKVVIDLDRTEVLSKVVAITAPYVAETTRQVLNRATVLTPKRTGNLQNANQMTMRARRTFVAGTVENRVKYALAVHNPTKPHTIKAKRKKALAFYWGRTGTITIVPKKRTGTGYRRGKKGLRFVIGKGFVRHPGTKGRPFLYRALYEVATARGFVVTPGPGLVL